MFASPCDRIIKEGRRQEVFGQLDFSLHASVVLHLSTYLDLMSPDAIALDRNRIALDRDRIVSDRDRIVSDRDRIVSDRDRIALDRDRIVSDRDRIALDRDRIVSDRDRIASHWIAIALSYHVRLITY